METSVNWKKSEINIARHAWNLSGQILAGDASFEESKEKVVLLEHFYTIFNQVLDGPA